MSEYRGFTAETGRAAHAKRRPDPPLIERFWAKVDRTGDGCWLWLAHIGPAGYGAFNYGGRMGLAHRFAYEIMVAPIPDGLTIDHLCRVRACVNPAHLEAVTMGENVLRGTGPSAVHARQTHCAHGHEFTPQNTMRRSDKPNCRVCRVCYNAYHRALGKRRRAERAP